MADQRDAGISWTDETWNPVVGCSIVSPACTNCYAMAAAHGIQAKNAGSRRKAMETGAKVPAETHYLGTTKVVNGKPVWTGKLVMAPDHIVTAPLRWKRPRRIFVNSMSDLFHEDMPDEWIDEVFAVMALSPQHTFQVLTKRPERMQAYLCGDWAARARQHVEDLTLPTFSKATADTQDRLRRYTSPGFPHPMENVWLGVTAEDQARADERIPHLLATPAAVRFVSAEPLLGPLDLYNGAADPRLGGHSGTKTFIGDWWEPGDDLRGPSRHGLDWVIVGGESGPGARPMHPDWVRSLRGQCEAAEVAFHFKQWGDWAPICNLADGEADTLYRSNRVADDHEDQLALDEIYGRTCKVPVEHLGYGGAKGLDAFFAVEGKGGMTFFKLGKARAGRTLDGRIHDAFPEAL
jgi:protein gp37